MGDHLCASKSSNNLAIAGSIQSIGLVFIGKSPPRLCGQVSYDGTLCAIYMVAILSGKTLRGLKLALTESVRNPVILIILAGTI